MKSKDASTLMREAQELKAAGRLDEAIGRYGEAVAANPKSGVAEHNLAAALGDAGRWAEARPHLEAAFAKGVDAPETWIVKARCDLSQGRLDDSERGFREALRRRPAMHEAHRELAQLIWMRTGDVAAALATLETAIKAAPADAMLQVVKGQALEHAGRLEEALAVTIKLAQANPRTPGYAVNVSQLAARLGHVTDAIAYAEQAALISPQELPVQVTLCEACIVAGDARRASDIAGNIRRRWSVSQLGVALQATAWRMLDDPRYRELYDYEAFVSASFLDTPSGWPSLEAYVADVGAALKSLHSFHEHPFNQSLRHGSQAVDILQQSHPALRALPKALDGPIRRRLAALGRGDDVVRSRNTGDYKFQGMWSVKLRPGGYHINHVHPAGWLSSACYVETVDPKDREGWIKFGEPGVKPASGVPALDPEHFVEPKPGLLVLFPSYMWHGTVPFSGSKTRLTFAFDLVPAEAPAGPESEP